MVLQAIPKLRVAELVDATSLFDLGIDSLDQAKVLMMVEDELGIEIDDEDINSLESINDLVAYCQARHPDHP